MLSPTEVYPLVLLWLQALGVAPHATAQAALAHLVTALLVGQSLRPSALMRALLSPAPVPARQRYKRVARAWERPWLTPVGLTPRLVRAALALVPPEPAGPTAGLTHLALDSVRCGRWELYTLGVVWHGRALPVAWAVLPYPLPKGRFGPTIRALVQQVAAAWPAGRPVHLVADRAFPSGALFRTLRAVGWGWTVRVRATDGVLVGGARCVVRELLATAREGGWTVHAGATFGTGPQAVPGTLVVGRGLVVVPAHQAGPASLRARAAQQARRQQHLATKKRGGAAAGQASDRWVALFTTHPTWRAATASYRRRWAIEGSYRDAQSGWDGQHGWDLEPVVARLPAAERVERVVGLWALGALLQTWVGHELSQAGPAEQAIVAQWTTTGRLSVWACGRLALTEPSGRLRAWVGQTLAAGAQRVAAGPSPAPEQCHCPSATPPVRQAA